MRSSVKFRENLTLFQVVQGRPRSLTLMPIESAYATSYWSLVVTLIVFRTVFKISTDKAKNSLSPHHYCLTPHGPHTEELPRISAYTLHFQKLESLSYIFAADNMVYLLSSLKFLQWALRDASLLR